MLQIKESILDGLKSCGYRRDFLRENYQYFDGRETKTAEIVGFSKSTYNSSTACIAAIDKIKLDGNRLETKLSSYQLLGCPVLLVYDNSGVQFWKNSGTQVALHERIESKKLISFFSKYKEEFSPESIYRAKTRRLKRDCQLSFDDIGISCLMGIIEEKEGKYLSELTERIIKSLKVNCKGIKEDSKFDKWLFQAGFWLIGAKILKDKGVDGFKTLQISNVEDLINRVQRHYNAVERLDISNPVLRRGFGEVAQRIVEPVASFAHITTESLAYVYENTLTSKETRKVLGTHATPLWLVNYIVWGELIDWIEAIPQENRVILEPACGHAPFLTAGAKLLSFLYKGGDKTRHEYLKGHLIGIDKDDFAEEIARLALTLADIPNPNGWKIIHSDIYKGDVLKRAAQKATILFCNPPFENFSPEEKQEYGNTITTGNKASEILAKTLLYLPDNSVFGIILPQGFLHRKNLAGLRESILDNFELRTICNLPDNVFAKAGHPSTVLLGRKSKRKAKTVYLRIHKGILEGFKNTYQAYGEIVSKDVFYKAKNFSFKLPELKEVWDYCKQYARFKEYAVIGRGIEYKNFDNSVQKVKFSGSTKGFGKFEKIIDERKVDISIDELPDYYWLSTKPDDIANPRYGLNKQNVPQVIANYARSGGDVWRIKGLLNLQGLSVTRNFLVIKPKSQKNVSLYVIWALINSPFANAYMYCNCMERHNMEGILRDMPVPFESQDLSKLNNYAQDYLSYSQQREFALHSQGTLEETKRKLLLAIDAEVMRLYHLPPRLEKMLLDFFAGTQRKGVDFEFDRYYPEGFGSYIPLHIFISEEFKNSTVENVTKWVEENRSPEIIKAFGNAVKAFEDD